ncbi:hypothetical protein TRFO_30368 [Tritrichomonas foetus]|uniref:Uncharacterized protein n=1 Tax=Tritrichomonas foetus TaxID=1144522 RepID=A0A1J4JY83_9EUKA|nr:hypothetical protein TRFO_30368 [Tritrichomonas foetus]|eukprot:OHT02484.1 hypothetical protein TRFO_30368 [Tritrichomonas foetus]
MIKIKRVRQMKEKNEIDENKNSTSLNILEAILEDDDEKLIEIVSQLDSDPNGYFEIVDYKVPSILKKNPPFVCLCCFF